MFTDITYQEWLEASAGMFDIGKLITNVIGRYKSSADFNHALTASAYFAGENTAVLNKKILKADATTVKDENGREKKKWINRDVIGTQIATNFFKLFVIQENQHLLSNGVTLENADIKKRLGYGFDKCLEEIGENALKHGVCWGFWNVDHLECIPAASDRLSGAVALLDEVTGVPMVLIQFSQIFDDKPLVVRLFETDGFSIWRETKNGLKCTQEKRAYQQTVLKDVIGETVVATSNYNTLPVIPLYANSERQSELTTSIKSKIDAYDFIFSDYGDNLNRTNDVYWVLNNFGGNTTDVATMIEEINRLKAVVNISDGTGNGSTAEPHTIEVPYLARQTALDLLKKALFEDYMALDTQALTGGSLTNVAIKAACANLNLKVDRYEWQVFQFVQGVLKLIGAESEQISFVRQTISNETETIQNIYMMREDIGQRKALELNPYIMQEEVEQIINDVSAERISDLPSIEQLQKAVDEG